MTPDDLLAISLEARRFRYPGHAKTEEEDWRTFTEAVHAWAAGTPSPTLERLIEWYGSQGAAAVYYGWRQKQIDGRRAEPVQRRRR